MIMSSQVRTNCLFVHAPNVHNGGGATLLSALLKEVQGKVVLNVDARMSLPSNISSNIHIYRIKPTIHHRLMAEIMLKKMVGHKDNVLCFGNLPPLFNLFGNVVVFLQNRYLIDNSPLTGFPLKTRLRFKIERFWLKTFYRNVSQFVVQTPTMKSVLKNRLYLDKDVHIFPFVAKPDGYSRKLQQEDTKTNVDYDFVYIATGEPHKNHEKLIDAWCLLAEEGIFPSICLTLDKLRFFDLCDFIEKAQRKYQLKIKNVGSLSHNNTLALLRKSAAVIYPSKLESFGLPLIEARQVGLPILASELDYVRDVLDPEETFDPESPMSIARAVKRFVKIGEKHLPLLDARKFLKSIF